MNVKLFEARHPDTGELVSAKHAARNIRFQCPYCHLPVILKRGTVRKPHFAHEGPACAGALETYLHHLAIHLIMTNPTKRIRLASGEWFNYTRAVQEYHIGSRRVDVMCGKDGTFLAVEIAVTHFLTSDKHADLRALSCPALEIRLTSDHKTMTKTQLRTVLINETHNKKGFGLLSISEPNPEVAFDWMPVINFLSTVAVAVGTFLLLRWLFGTPKTKARRRIFIFNSGCVGFVVIDH